MNTDQMPARLRSLYPYNCRRVDVGGAEMSFIDEGPADTRPVLMLHGNPSWSFYYRNAVNGLKERRRVIVPDHIGCGLSDKPQDYPYSLRTNIDNLKRLLEHLDIKEADLIVHDWGGAIGMGLVTEGAFTPGRIVILNTAAFIMPRVPLRIRICRIPGFGDLALRGANAFAVGATLMATEKPLAPEVKEGLLFPYNSWENRIATLRFVQGIPTNPRHPAWDLANRIHSRLDILREIPVQVHWGLKDFCFTTRCLDIWRELLPDARVFEYEHAGHYCLEDAHQQIVPEVKKFLCPETL